MKHKRLADAATKWVGLVVAGLGCFPLPSLAAQADAEIEKLETSYRFEANGTGQAIIHARWKVNTSAGRSKVGQFSIPYQSEFQDVQVKFFRTVKKNGETIEGDPTRVFERSVPVPDDVAVFTDSRLKSFVMPNVEAGDSVEYEAVIGYAKSLHGSDFWIIHRQQRSVPVASERVVLDLPADLKIAVHENSSLQHKTEERDGRRVEQWDLSNPEPASILDSHVETVFAVSTILTWDAFGDWIRGLNEPRVQPTPEIRALAEKLTAGRTTERDRIFALYTYVSEKVRYVSIDFGIGGIQPHAAAEVLRNAYGDCKDKHALLVSLLRAAGIKADAILATPGIGVLEPDIPGQQFIHEFTRVETSQGPMFLDATQTLTPPQLLMPGVRGKKALWIGSDKTQVIEVPSDSPIRNLIEMKITASIDASGKLAATTRVELQGMTEPAMRAWFRDGTNERREQLLRLFGGQSFQNASLTEKGHSDPEDLDHSFWFEYSFADAAFLPPNALTRKLAPFGGGTADPMRLVGDNRPAHPVPVDKQELEMSMDLQVDPSFIVTNGMPVHYTAPFGSFDSESSFDKGHLRLQGDLKFNGTAIEPLDWDKFMNLWGVLTKEDSLGLTLERRSSNRAAASNASERDSLRILLQSGLASIRSRDYNAARNALEEATRLDPKSTTAWNDLGVAYAGLRQYDKAEQAYLRQIEINPKDPNSYSNLGLVRRAQGRLPEAIELFQRQIEITPRHLHAHANLAVALGAQCKWEDAVREGNTAVELDPTNASAWVRLGQAQVKTGRLDEAKVSFEHAAQMSSDTMSNNNIAYQMIEANIDPARAWQLVSDAIAREAPGVCHPAKPMLDAACSGKLTRLALMLDTAGWVRFKQGNVEEAKQYEMASYAIAPHATIALHMAAILGRAGDRNRALRLFVEAQSAPGFDHAEADPIRAELVKLEGDEGQFEARLKGIAETSPAIGQIEVETELQGDATRLIATYRAVVLVDAQGKVLDAGMENGDEPVAGLLAYARRLSLPPLSWPDTKIQSVRTVEFRFISGKLQRILSYVVRPRESSLSQEPDTVPQ